MHLSTIIVNARAAITAAESQYANDKKGDCAETLAGLSVMVQDNLTIIVMKPPDEHPEGQPTGEQLKP